MDKITSDGQYSKQARAAGIFTLTELFDFMRALPYGRNSLRDDFSLVLTEKQGTCSSKHGFVKLVADENDIELKLLCCVYKLNGTNTPGAKPVYDKYDVEFIPEAHCVIEYQGEIMDLTSPTASYSNISADVLMKKEIEPKWLHTEKIKFHRDYLRKWLAYSGYTNSLEEIWAIREEMIQSL